MIDERADEVRVASSDVRDWAVRSGDDPARLTVLPLACGLPAIVPDQGAARELCWDRTAAVALARLRAPAGGAEARRAA